MAGSDASRWLGDTLGALIGDADGSQLGTALGFQDGWQLGDAQLEEATVGAQLGFSEHAVSTGRRGIITLAMALPKFILMEHLLNEDRLQYYQYLNIRN
jgi:hypothetical protein